MSEQEPMIAVLLPGLDGTGRMFTPFLAHFPAGLEAQVIAYPHEKVLSYAQLVEFVLPQLPSERPFILIAESFGGPLALQISTRTTKNLRAMVLTATFVRNPHPHVARLAPLLLRDPILSRRPAKWLARLFVMGMDVPEDLMEEGLAVHHMVSPQVIAQRLYEVIRVDVSDVLRECRLPVLHLYALHDHLIMQAPTHEIQQIRPDIESVGIDGPHYLLQTRPQQCADAIEAFLRKNGIGD